MVIVIALTAIQFRYRRAQGALLMVENTSASAISSPTSCSALGVSIVAFPVYLAFVAST